MKYRTYTTRPPQYKGDGLRVAGCCIIVAGKVLLIRRGPRYTFAGEYEIPGGKIEQGETEREAAIRETLEETGIDVSGLLRSAGVLYTAPIADSDAVDFEFHVFKANFTECPTVILEQSHTDFQWVTPTEALLLPYIVGTPEVFMLCGL